MPQYNRRELDTRAREYGFNRDTFEKVLRLRTILEFLDTQEYMHKHLLLKFIAKEYKPELLFENSEIVERL